MFMCPSAAAEFLHQAKLSHFSEDQFYHLRVMDLASYGKGFLPTAVPVD
jgi:hypothetical protein